MTPLLLNANAVEIPLGDESVHCVVTSPPYWGLRDYGITDQLGLEDTPEQYVSNMVAVFREVWRVLHPAGTLWLNLGDTYGTGTTAVRTAGNRGIGDNTQKAQDAVPRAGGMAKQLMGIPWRVAFALQADGWYLRSDIIWAKPNPMPESVTDRPTKSHEYLFLLTKRKNYFYDADAVRESASYEGKIIQCGPNSRADVDRVPRKNLKQDAIGKRTYTGFNERWNNRPVSGRNKRTVWQISTQAWKGAHFATFPPALVEPCIKAGSSEHGVCPECGSPWERVVKKELVPTKKAARTFIVDNRDITADENDQGSNRQKDGHKSGYINKIITLGFQPTCKCKRTCPSCAGGSVVWTINSPCCQNKGYVTYEPIPAIVLDPFAGSGTTLLVARKLGRRAVGLDLSYEYLHDQAKMRLGATALEEWEAGKDGKGKIDDLPLFAEIGAEP